MAVAVLGNRHDSYRGGNHDDDHSASARAAQSDRPAARAGADAGAQAEVRAAAPPSSVVAGIDYSTRAVDVVLLDEDTGAAEWHRFLLGGLGDAFERTRTVRAAMPSRGWWEDKGVVACGIEDPRGYAAGFAYRIQGAILQCLPASLLVQPWIPSAWRRAVGLPGNAPKQQVYFYAVEQLPSRLVLGDSPWPQDACDAYAIARATLAVVEREAA